MSYDIEFVKNEMQKAGVVTSDEMSDLAFWEYVANMVAKHPDADWEDVEFLSSVVDEWWAGKGELP